MSDHSGSSHFQVLFEAALRQYEKQTEIPLAKHPLAEQLQSCDSVDSVIAILQEQARAFGEFRGSDRIMKSLSSVISVLSTLSAAANLGETVGLSFKPTKAIQAGLAILLSAIKGVSASYEALVDLLESIDHFLRRLDIYSKVTPTPAMTEIIVKILVELLSTLALATKQIKQGRLKKTVKKLFGEKDVEVVLQRLDRLTHEEARMTAAQTLEVVYGLVENMKVVMDDGKGSIDRIQDALKLMQQTASDISKSKRDKFQQDVRSWLNPPDPWKNHNLACDAHHIGTAEWFIQGDAFSEWQSSGPSSLLWIHGKPGAGKSILCSTIIEEIDAMRKSGLASLAFFYCDFREDPKKDQRGLLSSVLVQLCHQSDSYCDILSNLYFQHDKGSRQPSDNSLVQCLKDMMKLRGQAPVYLIVDALDECPNTHALPSPRRKVLLFVEELINSKIPNLRICVSSRPETDIKAILEPLTFRSISLHDESGQTGDINSYIKSVVNTELSFRRWKEEDRQLVMDVLTTNAHGMFRWVYCQVVYLCGCLPGRIRQALAELPETLDETYERTLREIKKINLEIAHRLLQCVAVAFRPLRVDELAEFLAFDFTSKPIPTFHEGWRLEDPMEAVLSTCSTLLVIVDVKDEYQNPKKVIQFSHFSVKEYLTSDRLAESSDVIARRYHISMTPTHTLAAQACLGLLLHLDESITEDSLANTPLVQYAAKHWVDHAQFEGVSQNVEDGMKLLFDPGSPHLTTWVRIHDPGVGQVQWWPKPSRINGTPLHFAAVCGFHAIVKFLVMEHSQNVCAVEINMSTPLHLASRRGHLKVTQFLVEHNADVTAQDINGMTPLHLTSEGGHLEVARFLVEHNADISAHDNYGSTPLHLASEKEGNVEVARFLVERGADPMTQDVYGLTPLHLASFEGDVESIRLILEHGADLTTQTKDGFTPLHLALGPLHRRRTFMRFPSAVPKVEVIRYLVERGADATVQSKHGLTPLHLALHCGSVDVARFLVQHGVDVTAQDNNGMTPLHLASFWGNLELIHFILEHGGDATAQDNYGTTPIHLASEGGENVEVARVLLGRGADATARNKHGLTPLHLASSLSSMNMEFIRFILEHGGDATAQDKNGLTPLHLALGAAYPKCDPHLFMLRENRPSSLPTNYMEVIRFLLECGGGPTAQSKHGITPIHLASQRENSEICSVLIEHGADATAQDNEGMTPLHVASEWGRLEVAHFLVEWGVDATVHDNKGRTPLHLALQGGYMELARFLIERGSDATTQDNKGMTPLHQASYDRYLDVARLLVEHGADATAQDNHLRTPLHWASKEGDLDVACFLVEHGADATAQDNNLWTPLHWASKRGHLDVVRFLFEHGADATAQDNNLSTALHLAAQGRYLDVAQLLVKHSADVTSQNKHGSSPLHLTLGAQHRTNLTSRWRKHRSMEVLRFLVESGADVTAKNNNGFSPLHLASRLGHVEAAHFLVKHGANATAQDNNGMTPLHLASQGGREEVTRFLVEHGADVTAQDNHGMTPLHLASRGGHVRVARILVEHNADGTAHDNNGMTPLCLASRHGCIKSTRFLVKRGAVVTAQDNSRSTPLPRTAEIMDRTSWFKSRCWWAFITLVLIIFVIFLVRRI